MSKLTFLRTINRTVRGEEYQFHIFTDDRMIHVVGRGDKESTGKPHDKASGEFIVNDMIGALLRRGNIKPGEWEAA
jgi:hypothetical protein